MSLKNDTFDPFDAEIVKEPHNSHWAAKRRVASELRRLLENLVTTTSDADLLNEIAEQIRVQADCLDQDQKLYGRRSFEAYDGGSYGTRMSVGNELNPIGGQSNAIAPPMNVWIKGDIARSSVTLGWQYEGPPKAVHGGFVAALFDQFLGVAQKITGQPGVTGTLTTKFHKPTPIGEELQLIGRVDSVEGRKNIISGEMWAGDVMTASCQGIFIHITKAQFDSLISHKS